MTGAQGFACLLGVVLFAIVVTAFLEGDVK